MLLTMKSNYRLEKTINGLRKFINENNRNETYQITSEFIIVKNNSENILGTIFYIIVCLLLPICTMFYYIISERTYYVPIMCLLLILLFSRQLYTILKGNRTLEINLIENYIYSENVNPLFKTFYKPIKIHFLEIEKVELKKQSIFTKIGSINWNHFVIIDKKSKAYVLTDFNDTYFESEISKKLKLLLDVIIWTENNK